MRRIHTKKEEGEEVSNIIAAFLIMLALAGLGGSIETGLKQLGEDYKVAHGYHQTIVKTGPHWWQEHEEWTTK